MCMGIRKDSATHHVLKGLIPYTDSNLKLAYKPNLFFNELDKKLSKGKKSTPKLNNIKNAFKRSVNRGLITIDETGVPRLTKKGRRALAPFEAKIIKNAQLMVIFDIPEVKRWQRDKFRIVLKEFQFKQIQRSVWLTKLDCAYYIKLEIENLQLENDIKLYESKEIV